MTQQPLTTLRLGTRGSALATAQSGTVAQWLSQRLGRVVELVTVKTTGDVNLGSLEVIGGTGVFAAELREALRDGRCDIAVHSLKDLPTAASPGLRLAATPVRADARDALCARDGDGLDDLPGGSAVGTGSPRRAAQLLARRPDLRMVPVRGNVDTRLGKVAGGELDAVVLARAGLDRLGRADAVTETFDPEVMLPAAGQGSLAVECREDEADSDLLAALADLDDPATRAAVTAERTLLAAVEAGCTAPVGAHALVGEPGFWEPELWLRAVVCAADGSAMIRKSVTGPVSDAERLGRGLAVDLLDAGADRLLGERIA